MTKELMLAYSAGFFDGEGSINLLKSIRKNRGIGNPEYNLTVAMGQKDGATLDWIKDNFGGNVYLVKRDDTFFWALGNRKAIVFLKILLPYLQYKKPQAEAAIKYYEEMPKHTRYTAKTELNRREAIRQELISLKKTIVKSQYAGSTTKRVNSES